MQRLMTTVVLLAAAAAVPVMAGSPHADGAGTIMGLVTDPTGAPVRDAFVTISGPGGSESVFSNRAGWYQVSAPAPGRYMVTIRAAGFAQFHRTAPAVSEGQRREVDAPLQLNRLMQSVEVTE